MSDGPPQALSEGRLLPASHESLAFGVPPAVPGTLFALAPGGGITVGPKEGRVLVFGRNRPDVHVCLGPDDPRVSRQHIAVTYVGGRWWVRNIGRLPVRMAETRLLFANEDPVPLAEGFTPLLVRGSAGREHLVEVHVTGSEGGRTAPRPGAVTQAPRVWSLEPDERMALVVLGQRYLRQEHYPQPLSWRLAADQLAELAPDRRWTPKRVEHLVTAVRTRLSANGVAGLTREEVGEPVGNTLNHNLVRELLISMTLLPADLQLIDGDRHH